MPRATDTTSFDSGSDPDRHGAKRAAPTRPHVSALSNECQCALDWVLAGVCMDTQEGALKLQNSGNSGGRADTASQAAPAMRTQPKVKTQTSTIAWLTYPGQIER